MSARRQAGRKAGSREQAGWQAGLAFATNGTHVCMRDTANLYALSRTLRSAAVDCLAQNPHRRLFLQGGEYLRAGELVSAAAAQYDLTGEEYCEQMRRDAYWGGGPEIVALCNVLRRPIHVYELCSAAEVHPDEVGEPEGGDGGGEIIATGTPEAVAANKKSFTGQYLKPLVAATPNKKRA